MATQYYVCTDYRSTRNFFSYIATYAPGFDGDTKLTLDEAFNDLFYGMGLTSKAVRTEQGQAFLKEALARAEESLKLYREGKRDLAVRALQHAEDNFEKGYGHRSRRRFSPVKDDDD